MAGTEECDDGNSNNNDYCSNLCKEQVPQVNGGAIAAMAGSLGFLAILALGIAAVKGLLLTGPVAATGAAGTGGVNDASNVINNPTMVSSENILHPAHQLPSL